MPTIAVNGPLLSRVGTSPNVADPYLILARLGPKINGRSAAEVVSNLSLKLDGEIAAMEARKPGDVLGTVEVFSPSYYWRQSGYLAQPVIEFSIRNDGRIPISRVYFGMVLTTPGRSIPWASQIFVQEFKVVWSRARSGISACNSSLATGAIRNCSISPMLNSR
jgi:hypothetical protein